MCGIAGWYRRLGGNVGERTIAAQCDAIIHRGPDDFGIFTDRDFGFGMRRLSILDIAGGHQPMDACGGRFTIVFNGEIYNHKELRKPLVERGFAFRSTSDTETILAAFAIYGNDAWAKLEGMFAVAVWDSLNRELTLARDPLGIKPLYVTEQMGGIAFASELKALRILPGHEFSVNDRAVHDYFSFGHVRRPRSIFREVEMLEPGHFMTVKPDGPPIRNVYWQPELRPVSGMSATDWADEMRAQLVKTVGRHMQSDVPVGAFLSGGIDSSAVLAAMTENGHGVHKAFTIGYPGAKIDETAAAREIAQHLGCEHIVLALEAGNAIDVLPAVQRCFDEPFADMAAIPTWHASKLASEHVKVVLCGEGGDELFAGYKRHRNARNIERFRPLINSSSSILSLINNAPPTKSAKINYLRQHCQRFAEFARLPDGYQQFFAATQISREALRGRIYKPEFKAVHEGPYAYADLEAEYFPGTSGKASALDQFLFADLTVNMPSAMLTRLDRASMAHSVEARVPLLSHKMVDWALTVPTEFKLRGSRGKAILRDAIAPLVPPSTLKRPKQGFQMPLASWFRGDFGGFARDVWHESGAGDAGYLERGEVEKLFIEHRKGQADHSRMLYAIAVFGLWWADNRSGIPSTVAPAAATAWGD
ncbi:asparagine synthase (glutamine-hydrolyzing) [Rhizorhabdus argentea]|uniref:asparagine synthase (glutamine-hydrolyzing) n=1 Tax=Rhizorhabdus argentea TaxID=1387174 RepID=UPI0030ED7483